MRTVIRGIVRTQLLMLVTAMVGMADPVHKVGLTGRFIAYRPSDRLAQTASFVTNKEAFLLQAEDSKHKSIVKVEYEHVGYSDITEEMLEKAPLLNLKVRRNPSCDQSYSQFISTAPRIRDEQSGKEMIGRVKFVQMLKNTQLVPEETLECYVLQKGDFRVIADK